MGWPSLTEAKEPQKLSGQPTSLDRRSGYKTMDPGNPFPQSKTGLSENSVPLNPMVNDHHCTPKPNG